MSATDAAIGMMDGAYFTSRKEILDFLNTLLDLNLTKIEQTASGAVACQLTEYLFPNSIPMSRVDWSARSSHEYVANYKLLQSAFNKNKIRKHVDVDKLIRGKYQDNLEFCQWLKAFFDQTRGMMCQREGYDPVAVRARGKGGKTVERKKGGVVGDSKAGGKPIGPMRAAAVRAALTKSSGAVAKAPRAAAPASSSRPNSSSSSASRGTTSTRTHKENIPATSSTGVSKPRKSAEDTAALRTLQEENHKLKSKCTQLEEHVTEAELTMQTMESERDFYFNKLRGIEIMLQVYKEKEEGGDFDLGLEARRVIERAFKVMYATESDNVEVDDEGNLVGDVTIDDPLDEALDVNDASGTQDELEDDEELLTDGIEDPVEDEEYLTDAVSPDEETPKTFNANKSPAKHFFSDDDFDDEELLTDGLDDELSPQNAVKNNSPVKPVLVDDDSFDDENLLSD